MSIITKQAEFHIMRGHVADGTTVLMPGGGKLTIKSDIVGWKLTDEKGNVLYKGNSAYGVQDAILTYNAEN